MRRSQRARPVARAQLAEQPRLDVPHGLLRDAEHLGGNWSKMPTATFPETSEHSIRTDPGPEPERALLTQEVYTLVFGELLLLARADDL